MGNGKRLSIKYMVDDNEIKKLLIYLEEYERVYVIKDRIPISASIFQKMALKAKRKILLLTREESQDFKAGCGIEIKKISCEEYCFIEKMYQMYEFSDCIHMLTDSDRYGSLCNYVSSGLLTEEELFTALFE